LLLKFLWLKSNEKLEKSASRLTLQSTDTSPLGQIIKNHRKIIANIGCGLTTVVVAR
jgi:hypothetical protein